MPAALAEAAREAARETGVGYHADALTRYSASRDFGGVAHGSCLLAAEPSNSDACARLVGSLRRRGIGCTVRGTGYGQGGQSVALDTVSLSTRRLDAIAPIDHATRSITVGSGATLRRVLHVLHDAGLTPAVLPLNLDMSIGGLLSAAGLGPTSHRHGPLIAHVAQVEVVTGDGELRTCTRQRNADLFDAVLGGLGQCGLITQATLELRPAPRHMRIYSFLYDDPGKWLQDQLLASDVEGVEFNIEGFCWAAAKGPRGTHWMYGLHLGVDEEAANGIAVRQLLDSLKATRKLDEHEADYLSYLQRYEPRFSGMVQSGAWAEPHPWFEGIIPIDRAEELLVRMLHVLPAEVGDGHRFMLVDTRQTPGSFLCPPGRRAGLVGIFPTSFARSELPNVLRTMDQLTRLIVEVTGKRYLSGWLGSDAEFYLRSHFGERYGEWLAVRRRYDPDAAFRSKLFPHGNRG
jgi:cytokinin dehydrogenase